MTALAFCKTAYSVALPVRAAGGITQEKVQMNLHLSGHHLGVTPAIRSYVLEKLGRATRHFDQVIDLHVIMSVEKLRHKVEVSVHVAGKDIHVESTDADMYAAIDALADKLDRQFVKHKEKLTTHRHETEPIKRQIADA